MDDFPDALPAGVSCRVRFARRGGARGTIDVPEPKDPFDVVVRAAREFGTPNSEKEQLRRDKALAQIMRGHKERPVVTPFDTESRAPEVVTTAAAVHPPKEAATPKPPPGARDTTTEEKRR